MLSTNHLPLRYGIRTGPRQRIRERVSELRLRFRRPYALLRASPAPASTLATTASAPPVSPAQTVTPEGERHQDALDLLQFLLEGEPWLSGSGWSRDSFLQRLDQAIAKLLAERGYGRPAAPEPSSPSRRLPTPPPPAAETDPPAPEPPESPLGALQASMERDFVVQRFQKGAMIWADGQIIALYANGGGRSQLDGFQEGMMSHSGLTPPAAGLQEPVRGFGKAWRENEELRAKLGWAVEEEHWAQGHWSQYERGTRLQVEGIELTQVGPRIESNLARPSRPAAEPAPMVAPPAPAPPSPDFPQGAMQLSDYPRPPGDNGRGIHWVPTFFTDRGNVDRFVREAKEMKMKWVVFLNGPTQFGDNDYLVQKLRGAGIEPIMRIYTPGGEPIQGDLRALVHHYKALGVNYYQLYNEPNLTRENQGQFPDVGRYLDLWIPAAKAITAAGGLPGFGALAPGGDLDDMEFLRRALDEIKARGETAVLDHAWVSMHNYTWNHPLDYMRDSNGFLKFRWYDAVIREKLGRSLPLIGTEGGTHVGNDEDNTFPVVDEAKQLEMVVKAYEYMRNREPYNFAYTYWVIANQAGGGWDAAFEHQALFRSNYTSPLVAALKSLV